MYTKLIALSPENVTIVLTNFTGNLHVLTKAISARTSSTLARIQLLQVVWLSLFSLQHSILWHSYATNRIEK